VLRCTVLSSCVVTHSRTHARSCHRPRVSLCIVLILVRRRRPTAAASLSSQYITVDDDSVKAERNFGPGGGMCLVSLFLDLFAALLFVWDRVVAMRVRPLLLH
jgi:hypothetical protein